jgi:hypothetical protein
MASIVLRSRDSLSQIAGFIVECVDTRKDSTDGIQEDTNILPVDKVVENPVDKVWNPSVNPVGG